MTEPLGSPIRPDPPKPAAQDWRPYKPGFEINGLGQLRTTTPPPPPKPAGWDWWLANHSGEA